MDDKCHGCREAWTYSQLCDDCNKRHLSTATQRAADAERERDEACGLLSGAVALIAAERKRQVSAEGWTPEHDDGHTTGEIATAASCYALPESGRTYVLVPDSSPPGIDGYSRGSVMFDVPDLWPWEPEAWKPSGDRIRELVKAGALIAAEIDRLSRLAQPKETKP